MFEGKLMQVDVPGIRLTVSIEAREFPLAYDDHGTIQKRQHENLLCCPCTLRRLFIYAVSAYA